MRIGVYPGSFDPATLGHLDIIQRASKLFDKLIVAAMINGEKTSAFTMEEKVDFLKRMTADLPNVEVECFSGLLADYVREKNACAIVKGLRAVSDFEYEFKMCAMNRRLNENIETVFLMASEKHQFVSSVFAKEICKLGGDISSMVSPEIAEKLIARYKELGEIK